MSLGGVYLGDDVCKQCGRDRADHEHCDDTPHPLLKCPAGRGYATPDHFDPAATPADDSESILSAVPVAGPVGEPGDPRFLKLLDEMRSLHQRKAADYGRGVDPLANCRASAEFGVAPWVGVMIRANDKLHRIKSFTENGTLKNESLRDSLMDLAAYSLIAVVLLEEQG